MILFVIDLRPLSCILPNRKVTVKPRWRASPYLVADVAAFTKSHLVMELARCLPHADKSILKAITRSYYELASCGPYL
jgi:hypothetical protein